MSNSGDLHAILAVGHCDGNDQTPVARTHVIYAPGSPQAELLAAVDRRYPATREDFFRDVASFVSVTQDSAAGSFYGFLRATRALPDTHRHAYGQLLDVDTAVIDAVAALRQPAQTPERRDRLEELEAEVARLTAALETAGKAHDRLRARVLAVERAAGLRPSRARPAELATQVAPTRRGRAAR